MTKILDSILTESIWREIAWTIHQTKFGDKKIKTQLFHNLNMIFQKYHQVQFIVQGTHRPILGDPNERDKYLKSWVPAVFVNASLKF
jgi:hypothetical protein